MTWKRPTKENFHLKHLYTKLNLVTKFESFTNSGYEDIKNGSCNFRVFASIKPRRANFSNFGY